MSRSDFIAALVGSFLGPFAGVGFYVFVVWVCDKFSRGRK